MRGQGLETNVAIRTNSSSYDDFFVFLETKTDFKDWITDEESDDMFANLIPEFPREWVFDWCYGFYMQHIEEHLDCKEAKLFYQARALANNYPLSNSLAEQATLVHVGDLEKLRAAVLDCKAEDPEILRTQKHLADRLDLQIDFRKTAREDPLELDDSDGYVMMFAHYFVENFDQQAAVTNPQIAKARQISYDVCKRPSVQTAFMVFDCTLVDKFLNIDRDSTTACAYHYNFVKIIALNIHALQTRPHRFVNPDTFLHEMIHAHQKNGGYGSTIDAILIEGATESLACKALGKTLLQSESKAYQPMFEVFGVVPPETIYDISFAKDSRARIEVIAKALYNKTDIHHLNQVIDMLNQAADRSKISQTEKISHIASLGPMKRFEGPCE